jgi:hypothetical protein
MPRAADVLEPAREAFTQGLQVAATLSGVLLATAAVMVAVLLRGEKRRARTARPVAVATQSA